jgi:hypothetical protein
VPRRSSPHRLIPRTVVPAAWSQLTAVVTVGAIGVTALAAAQTSRGGMRPTAAAEPRAAVTHAAAPRPELPVRRADAAPVVHLAPPVARHPERVTVPHRPVASPRTARWLPSGTGMWIYQWKHTQHGNAAAVVARARAAGLTHLFVRTGSSHDGWQGSAVLPALLPAAGRADIKIVAWDFPELKAPVADARRLARAAWFDRRPGHPHVAAVAPDIETPAEGTKAGSARVALYLRSLRHLLPSNVAILTTVPWPSGVRRGHYAYGTVARYSDALLPMAYWYNNSPQVVTATSMQALQKFRRPVMPVGQGYDGKLDVPALPHNDLVRQVPAFFATAHRFGARSVSLWSWQSAPPAVWRALRQARALFPSV